MASAMPAQPHVSSSATRAGMMPVPSPKVCWRNSVPYSPTSAAFFTIGHGNSSASSYWCATGRISFSAKLWTQSRISFCSSLSSNEIMSFALAPALNNALVLVRTVFGQNATPPGEDKSMLLPTLCEVGLAPSAPAGRGLTRLPALTHRLDRQPVGAEDQEGAPDPGQDGSRDLDGHQGADDGPDHSPTSHQQRRLSQHVAAEHMAHPAHDRGGNDGDERSALGHRLGQPQADRHGGHEQQPAADADGAAQEAGPKPAEDRHHVAPAHGAGRTPFMETGAPSIRPRRARSPPRT